MADCAALADREEASAVEAKSGSRMLIVEDDPALVQLLEYVFQKEEFDVRTTPDGEEAIALAISFRPSIILLDWMILNLSGLEVLKRLRRSTQTADIPIIMISAKGEETDRLAGLSSGADDYVSKPVSPRELVARVRAVLRRNRPIYKAELLSFGDVELNLSQHKVRRAGKLINLGPKEFSLLRHFMQNPERVFSREKLITVLWGSQAEIDRRTIDVLIRRLRQALNTGFDTELIRTVRSEGYALSNDG